MTMINIDNIRDVENEDVRKEDVDLDKRAVALRYKKDEDAAPKVIAKGRGYVAESILQAAQKAAVPVYQNKTLTSLLMALEVDREIPPDLYSAMAEVLAYVYRMDKKSRPKIHL